MNSYQACTRCGCTVSDDGRIVVDAAIVRRDHHHWQRTIADGPEVELICEDCGRVEPPDPSRWIKSAFLPAT